MAFRSRHRYEPAHLDARPWLYGIARNVLRSHWARRAGSGVDRRDRAAESWADVDDRLDPARMGPALRHALRALSVDGAACASASRKEL